jgi:hypothetical protein
MSLTTVQLARSAPLTSLSRGHFGFVHHVKKMKMSKKTICVDFDGVIHAYSKGFHDGTIYDPPTPGTSLALQKLHDEYKVVVLSARARDERLVKQIWDWLATYQLDGYVSSVTNVKPPAVAYIDDRAITFIDWADVPEGIRRLGEF